MGLKKRVFKLVNQSNGVSIEVFVDYEGKYLPIIGPFSSEQELQETISLISTELQRLLEQAKALFQEESSSALELQDMPADEIWKVLENIKDEQQFVDRFNSLEEEKRKEVADFVLANCNVFSGNASIFSMRYNSDLALLE